MNKIVLFLLTSLFITCPIKAQLEPIYNVQSPEVANLGMFGTIPVSHFTGVPDISIPLFNVNSGKYTLPVSMSYHLASVKPDSQYGSLGLGWNLIAGGYISRTVNCIYDEKRFEDGTQVGFYGHAYELDSITTASYIEKVNRDYSTNVDLSADEFTFSFCGYSGSFYYSGHGEWTVISDANIKIEFDAQNDGFVYITDPLMTNRFHLSNWQNRECNTRFFNKFTLVTPDGCRYEFGGVNATEYSISYYNRNKSDLIPTTWHLSRIVTTDNRTINFEYDTDLIQCDIRYVPQRLETHMVMNEPSNHNFLDGIIFGGNYPLNLSTMVENKGIQGYTGFLIFPAYLRQITSDCQTVTFNYRVDYAYGKRFAHQDRRVLYYESPTPDSNRRFDPYGQGYFSPQSQYFALLNIGYQNASQMQEDLSNLFKCKYIQSIVVASNYDSGIFENYEFDYEFNNRPKVCELKISGSLQYSVHNVAYSQKKYAFNYNVSTRMPFYFVFPSTDSWGYYHGDDIVLAGNPVYSYVAPVESATKAETLKEIIYPTGGKTQFEYELNDYSKVVAIDRQSVVGESGRAGGLRIKSIKQIDDDGHVVNTKRYRYVNNINSSISSGILREKPYFKVEYKLYDYGIFDNPKLTLYSKGGYWTSANNQASPIVGYSNVIEETLDGDGNRLGYVKYNFSNYDLDIYGNTHFDETYVCSNCTDPDNLKPLPYTSKSMERGKLLSEEYFSPNNDTPIKKITYRYANTGNSYIYTSTQRSTSFPMVDGNITYVYRVPTAWLTKTYTYSSLKASSADTTYSQNGQGFHRTSCQYTYNSDKLPKTIVETARGLSTKTTTFRYPSEMPTYAWMTERHILSPVTSVTTTERGKSTIKNNEYSQTASGIPYLSRVSLKYNSNNYKSDYQVNAIDSYGNPIEIEQDGMKSVLYWGFHGQALMAKIDNFSIAEAVTLGMDSPADYAEEDLQWASDIAKHFYQLPPSAHMHIYDFCIPGLQDSYMNPAGFATFYEYDGLKRLRESYYYDHTNDGHRIKQTTHRYDYQYKNE